MVHDMPVGAGPNPYEADLETFVLKYQLPTSDLADGLPEVSVSTVDLADSDYDAFLRTLLPYHEHIGKGREHKKKLEMFISYSLLRPDSESVFMDAAGGGYSYAGTLDCQQAYLQDIRVRDSVKERVGSHVHYIEASVAHMPLPDNSVDAIACHHAFEHFQGSADTDFIIEAQRILKPGGRLVVIPIFISRVSVEMTNKADFSNWSAPQDCCMYDPDATLPGKYSGNFARIYNLDTFKERILRYINPEIASVTICEPYLQGRPIPNPEIYRNRRISKFNYPYRALVLTKR